MQTTRGMALLFCVSLMALTLMSVEAVKKKGEKQKDEGSSKPPGSIEPKKKGAGSSRGAGARQAEETPPSSPDSSRAPGSPTEVVSGSPQTPPDPSHRIPQRDSPPPAPRRPRTQPGPRRGGGRVLFRDPAVEEERDQPDAPPADSTDSD